MYIIFLLPSDSVQHDLQHVTTHDFPERRKHRKQKETHTYVAVLFVTSSRAILMAGARKVSVAPVRTVKCRFVLSMVVSERNTMSSLTSRNCRAHEGRSRVEQDRFTPHPMPFRCCYTSNRGPTVYPDPNP